MIHETVTVIGLSYYFEFKPVVQKLDPVNCCNTSGFNACSLSLTIGMSKTSHLLTKHYGSRACTWSRYDSRKDWTAATIASHSASPKTMLRLNMQREVVHTPCLHRCRYSSSLHDPTCTCSIQQEQLKAENQLRNVQRPRTSDSSQAEGGANLWGGSAVRALPGLCSLMTAPGIHAGVLVDVPETHVLA